MDLIYPNEKKLFRIAIVLAVLFWLLLIVGTIGIALIYILLFFLMSLFFQAGFITYVKGSGVLITEEQFPDIYARLLACCEKVGVTEVPDTYLLRTDFFNAIATRFLRRHYIVLFTDVIDALEDRPDAMNFYIGHELGHIHRQHIFWGWILAPALFLPVLGYAHRRAEEYTCDRYGNACCATDEDAVAALAAIVAGDTRWKTINVPAYLKQVDTTGGFWMSLNEFTSDYPWLSKRMAWLLALREGREPDFPRRHPLAGFLTLFVPSIPGGLGALIIFAAIFGVLAAVALPAYQAYIETAAQSQLAMDAQEQPAPDSYPEDPSFAASLTQDNLAQVLEELGTLRQGVSEYHAANDGMPTALSQIGWEQDILSSSYGGMPVQIYDQGMLLVSFGSNAEGGIYFVNEPAVADDGQVTWYCYGQNLPDGVLPAACE